MAIFKVPIAGLDTLATLLKKNFNTGVFLSILQNFLKHLLWKIWYFAYYTSRI